MVWGMIILSGDLNNGRSGVHSPRLEAKWDANKEFMRFLIFTALCLLAEYELQNQ
jgi:hypothetical protein